MSNIMVCTMVSVEFQFLAPDCRNGNINHKAQPECRKLCWLACNRLCCMCPIHVPVQTDKFHLQMSSVLTAPKAKLSLLRRDW